MTNNADRLDRVRRGQESVTRTVSVGRSDAATVSDVTRCAYNGERPEHVQHWMLRWDAIRGTKVPRLVDIEVLEYIEYLEARLYHAVTPAPERTSEVAGLLRDAAGIIAAFLDGSANYETRNNAREWLKRAGLEDVGDE